MRARLAEARQYNRGGKMNANRLTALVRHIEFNTPTIELTLWICGKRLTWSSGRYDTPVTIGDW